MSLALSNDSKVVVAVTKKGEGEIWIRQYDLETHVLTFEESLIGTYIKCKEVEQTNDGQKFLVCCNDDGGFYFRTFGRA